MKRICLLLLAASVVSASFLATLAALGQVTEGVKEAGAAAERIETALKRGL